MVLTMLSILGYSPFLIATIRVSSKFRAFRERFYYEIIQLQALKVLRKKNNAVWGFAVGWEWHKRHTFQLHDFVLINVH